MSSRIVRAVGVMGAVGIALAFSGRASAQSGQELYDKHCKRCHAEDGTGKKDGQPLSIVKALKIEDKPELLDIKRDDAKELTDNQITEVITKGKEKMKPNDKVTPDEIKKIVEYVRQLQAK